MNKIVNWLRQPDVWGFFVAVAVMALISVAFFYPDNVEGNSLRQADMQQGAANGREAKAFYEATGEKALWTDALFGGMPTFQISPEYPSNSLFTWLNKVYGLGLPAPSNLLFMMMFGFFILLGVMNLRWYYALIGAIAWGFSSYFVIIIGAGHIWKFVTLTYVPPTIAGMVLCYRGRYVIGAAMTALFAMLQLNANHPQMTYYFGFVMVFLAIAWLVEAIREKQVKRWLTASAVVLAAGALAIGANLPSLYNTYEYSKETKRAQSELVTEAAESSDIDVPAEKPTGGLPRHEIVGWSYGKCETLSLLIPNIKGGASAKPENGGLVSWGLDRLDDAAKYPNATNLLPYLPQYYNDSEGTNGPVYVGAAICALFLLGCAIVKGPLKWALLGSTVFSIVMAWGANLEWLTDLMIYHFPMYNKFRAVESILVIAEFAMPLLAILALKELLTADAEKRKEFVKPTIVVFGICAFFSLLAWIAPSIFGDAITPSDHAREAELTKQIIQMGRSYNYGDSDIQQLVYQYSLSNPDNAKAVESLRYGLLSSDGFRSLAILLVVGLALFGFLKAKIKSSVCLAVAAVAVLFDLYNVDKRYVDHASFVAVAADTPEFTPDEIDKAILEDGDHYRVMDIPGFSRPDRSYFHKTVGGYHAAKLNRYEDLIQRKLSKVMFYEPALRNDSARAEYLAETADPRFKAIIEELPSAYRVLDMLNARYIITGDRYAPVMQNTNALGAAWLVDRIEYVDGANAEMDALDTLDPATEAVADRKFASALGSDFATLAAGDNIALTEYTPNRLTYHSSAANPALGVFSEIWFPWGWKATIDGAPAPIGRVNYVLRALAIPAGEHDIVMTFDPDSLHVTASVAYASVGIIYLLVLLGLLAEYRRRTKKTDKGGAAA